MTASGGAEAPDAALPFQFFDLLLDRPVRDPHGLGEFRHRDRRVAPHEIDELLGTVLGIFDSALHRTALTGCQTVYMPTERIPRRSNASTPGRSVERGTDENWG